MLIHPVAIVAYLLIGAAVVAFIVLFVALDRRLKEQARRAEELHKSILRPFQARRNVVVAIKALLDLMAEHSARFWPTPEQLRAYLMDSNREVENPFTEKQELVLVFQDRPAGPTLSGRTIIYLIKPGKAVAEVRDQNGIDTLYEDELPLAPLLDRLFEIKALQVNEPQ